MVASGLFLVAGRVLSVTDGLLPGTQRTNSASRAQNRGFCAFLAFRTPVFGLFEHKIDVFVRFCPSGPPFSSLPSTKSAFLCSGRGKRGIGKRKVAFVQITAHANVPQTCLEQGFVCAVICRNCAMDNQQHHLPPNICALGWHQPHPAPKTCVPARRQPHSAEIRRWRRQSVQMGRKICYV